MKELPQVCSDAAGCNQEVAEAVINKSLSEIVQKLAMGHTVDLGPEFGVFSAKLRQHTVPAGSPRIPKEDHDKVVFREGKGMARRLKTSASRYSE